MLSNLTIRDAIIIFRNFSGTRDKYKSNVRGFSVVVTDPLAAQLAQDGWNIRPLRMRDGDEEQRYQLPVTVGFKVRPPKIICVNGFDGQGVELTEGNIATLDWCKILKADVVIRPREYTVNGKSGIKAYLQSLGVIIESDEVMNDYTQYLTPAEPVMNDQTTPF